MGITQNKKRPAEASLFRIYKKTFLNALQSVSNIFSVLFLNCKVRFYTTSISKYVRYQLRFSVEVI